MTSLLPLALLLSAAPGDTACVRVDDLIATCDEAASKVRTLLPEAKQPDAKALADGVVAELLLAAEARRSGLAATPKATTRIAYARQQLLANLFVDEVVGKGMEATEEEVKALFHRTGDAAKLQMLVFKDEATAKAVHARLAAGGDWALEATQSLSHKETQGKTPPMNRAVLDPAISDKVFQVPLNELQGPTQLRLGVAVYKVLERQVADEAGLAARRAELKGFARQQMLAMARAHYLKQLRAATPATIDEPFLASVEKAGQLTPAQAAHPVAKLGDRPIRYDAVLPALDGLIALRGHISGTSMKRRSIELFLDERRLSDAAEGAGLPAQPKIARRLLASEQWVLAATMAESIRAEARGADAQGREKALLKRIAKLRERAKISVNEAALAAALR